VAPDRRRLGSAASWTPRQLTPDRANTPGAVHAVGGVALRDPGPPGSLIDAIRQEPRWRCRTRARQTDVRSGRGRHGSRPPGIYRGPLFSTEVPRRHLTDQRLSHQSVALIVKRRALGAGVKPREALAPTRCAPGPRQPARAFVVSAEGPSPSPAVNFRTPLHELRSVCGSSAEDREHLGCLGSYARRDDLTCVPVRDGEGDGRAAGDCPRALGCCGQ
jgi:hypothetical protein